PLMAKTTEHGKPPAVVRVIELVGVSSKSWSDAAQQAVTRASQTLRHVTGVDVVKSSAVVKDGKIIEDHVDVELAFLVGGAGMAKPEPAGGPGWSPCTRRDTLRRPSPAGAGRAGSTPDQPPAERESCNAADPGRATGVDLGATAGSAEVGGRPVRPTGRD